MKSIACFLFFFTLTCAAQTSPPESELLVNIQTGRLKGAIENDMRVFKGIPYAAPPVGDLRWRPPQSPIAWTGTRDATKFGKSCLQPVIKNLTDDMGTGDEDCLHLNVFTPLKNGKNLPVMVWIHGGGLLVDGARDTQFTPVNLVANDVIVVTFDYRLGKLGFFATQELIDEAQKNGEPVGNYGIMDQIQVLKWIKQNISAFGGNPDNVTIFGESAGGRSVTWLMVSDAAKGLFHRAIAQSAQQTPIRGITQTRMGLVPEIELEEKFISAIGGKSLNDLRKLPANKILISPAEFEAGEFGGAFIDGKILQGDPVPLFAQGKQAKVPFLIGTNSWDSSFFVPGQPNLDTYLKKIGEDAVVIDKLFEQVNDRCILSSDVMGDMWYRAATKVLADSMNGVAPGYAYYFDYLTENIRPAYPGVPHSFEITYVFGSLKFVPQAPQQPESNKNQCARIQQATVDLKQKGVWSKYWYPSVDQNSAQDNAMSEKMAQSWAAFAKSGDPNVKGQSHWPVYNLKDDVMRNFSYDKETIQGLLKDRIDYQTQRLKTLFGIAQN
jgi:para-nitrobenzyl esterase